MISSKPQIVNTTFRPATSNHHAVAEQDAAYIVGPVPLAHLPAHYRIFKRVFDFTMALLLLILLSPLFLLIYLAIKLDDGGPAIIVQKRVGRGGRVFDFYKFRSMVHTQDHAQASKEFAQKVIRGEITEPPKENGGLLKPLSNGRVITRVGKILRKTSLDELPQLFNILKGDMSFVGPRPSIDYEAEAYFDWYLPRLSVLPGITGLAQINGRSSIPFPEIVAWDLKYIEEASILLDLKIFLRTIPVVIGMKNTG
ncbi:MAG TPA: sugar transferase [Anaerolineae bacterium]|nr:sugar transferase [Anaerolineae bacterium]